MGDVIQLSNAGRLSPNGRAQALSIKVGSCVVQIYGARGAGPYTIAWRESAGGPRKRAMRSDLIEAKQFAREIAIKIANGEGVKDAMTPADRASLLRALELLAPTGESIELACSKYAAAAKVAAAEGFTVQEAVEDFAGRARRSARAVPPVPIPTLVEEFLEAKKQDDISDRWRDSLASQLKPFARCFDCPLQLVRAEALNRWLRGLEVGNRTRVNYRGAVSDLVTYAKTAGHLPKEWDELERVPVPTVHQVEIKILTPEQLIRLLAAAHDNLVPLIALTAFAGIRHGEMSGKTHILDWRDLHWDEKLIYVPAGAAKTGASRLIPLSEQIVAWLAPYARRNGPVCELTTSSNALIRTKKRAGIDAGPNETRNTLRKSYISYRLAIVKNIAQVAEEAGNSPAKIRSNYNHPISPAEAKRWFDIRPTDAGILQLQFALV